MVGILLRMAVDTVLIVNSCFAGVNNQDGIYGLSLSRHCIPTRGIHTSMCAFDMYRMCRDTGRSINYGVYSLYVLYF